MRNFRLTPPSASNQRGQSLISVLIALGILGIVISSASVAFKNIITERRLIQSSAGRRDVEDVLVQQITKTLKEYVSLSCTPAAKTSKIDNIAITGLGNLNLTKTLQSQVTLTGVNLDRFKRVASRCAANRQDMTAGASYSRLYGCYQIQLSPSFAANTDKNSFAANKGGFIEILATLKDFRTDSPVACNQFDATDSAQLFEVYYAIHWIINSNKGYIFKTNVGTANVSM